MKWVGVVAWSALFLCVQAYNDSKCSARRGRCQYTWSSCSNGQYVRNLCGGPASRRCCVPDQSYDDSRCAAREGTCQMSSSPCRGGSYVSNLCGGPANRRCCIKQTASAGCSALQKRLACELYRDSNIQAARRHPSGERDNAYAYNNLRDMCNGGQASRSSYRCNSECHAPGGTTCLSTNLLEYLVDLKKSGRVIINELAGACHSCKSRHFSGLAVDLHKDRRTQDYIAKCKEHRGKPIPERNHVHCQFYDGTHPNW